MNNMSIPLLDLPTPRMQLDTVRFEARNPERTKGGGMNSISLATGAPSPDDAAGDG